jgi:hypothetical protein
MINGGQYQYIYIGDPDSYENIYGVEFQITEEIYKLSIDTIETGYKQQIAYNSNLLVSAKDLVFPEDAKLKEIDQNPSGSTNPTDPSEQPGPVAEEEEELIEISLSDIFLGIFKKSIFILIAIAICGAGLAAIGIRKKIIRAKQVEDDQYDDQHIQ